MEATGNYCNHQTSASLALNHVAAPSFLNRPLTFLTFWSQAEKVFCAHRTQISKYITLNWELADFSFKQKVWETQRRVRALWGKRIHETAFCLGFFFLFKSQRLTFARRLCFYVREASLLPHVPPLLRRQCIYVCMSAHECNAWLKMTCPKYSKNALSWWGMGHMTPERHVDLVFSESACERVSRAAFLRFSHVIFMRTCNNWVLLM